MAGAARRAEGERGGGEATFPSSIAKLEGVGGVVDRAAVRAIERQVAFVAGTGGRSKAGEADD